MTNHDIPYPSAAKKSELVKLYNKKIKPNREKWRDEIMNAKASAEGIEDVAASKTSKFTGMVL